ncbi:MAG: AMP-binding protein [Deltaproteobacteria bacterium HGW-Deltaproteobacteria-4]|nr:MAG: AMP-binding protein [Deltaproteobacteria bacterium HGW-Deltaproteobacteria-4]
MQTLIDLFVTFAGQSAKPALIYHTGIRRLSCSYQRLDLLARQMNRWLALQGIGAGDKVLLWAPNSLAWAVAFWGIVCRGAIVVPVDFMSDQERAATIADLTGARLAIQSRFKLEPLSGPPSVLIEDLEFLLNPLAPLHELAAPDAGNTAELIYTSGTTGAPKGVILTHRNLIANLLQVNAHLPVVKGNFTFLSLLPLSHMFEQTCGFLIPLYHGAAIVYLRTLKPSAIMAALAVEDIYAVIAVPRLLQLLKGSIETELAGLHLDGLLRKLLRLGARVPRSLRKWLFFPVHRKFGRHFTLFVSGGAPLDPVLFDFWNALGFVVVEGYGLSECSPVLTANTLQRQVRGSVGTALPGVEVKIKDGEILVRGDNVFRGYEQNPAATAAAFAPDFWFRTGDLGEVDEEGWLRIKGRSKELIVTGAGINVYPDEIEQVLNALPGVREACVIGLDKGGGEEVHAVLLLNNGEESGEEVVAAANRHLDALQQITSFSLWPETDFPKTTTLKIQKFKVRQHLHDLQGQGGTISHDPLLTIIAAVTGNDTATIGEESLLVASLGLTSIGRLELVSRLEQEFRLDLDDAALNDTTSVADLRRLLAQRKKSQAARDFRFWTNTAPGRFIRQGCDFFIHYPLLRAIVTLKTTGTENLAEIEAPVLFIANHTSLLDQPVIMFSLPRSWRYHTATAAWEEFFFKNFQNRAGQLWKRLTYEYSSVAANVFPLPQSGSFRPALQYMGKLADHRCNILLFPEGERTRDGQLLPLQPGLGIIVQELGIPVVPVWINGLEKVLPRGARWPKRGRVTVTFGAALTFHSEEPPEIVGRARQALLDLASSSGSD